MKKLLALGIAAFFLANIVSAISLVSFYEPFYDSFYTNNETAQSLGMSHEDLMKGTNHLLDYLQEKETELNVMVVVNQKMVPMYNDKEIEHMVDVLHLYQQAQTIQWILYGLFGVAILLWAITTKTNKAKQLVEASKLALYLVGLLIGSIMIVALVDFNWFWNVFHELVFDNDLWLLNPLTDRLIVMVPLAFFKRLVFSIVLAWLLSLGVWFMSVILLKRRTLA